MKKLLFLTLIAGSIVACKKKDATPSATIQGDARVEFNFKADSSKSYVLNYYDRGGGSTVQTVQGNTFTYQLTVPSKSGNVHLFFNVGQNPPYVNRNQGAVSIKVNDKVVATGSTQFTSTTTLAGAGYDFLSN